MMRGIGREMWHMMWSRKRDGDREKNDDYWLKHKTFIALTVRKAAFSNKYLSLFNRWFNGSH